MCVFYDGNSRRFNRKWFYGEAGNRICDPWFTEGVDRGGGGGTGIEGAESGVEVAESGVEGAGSGSRGGGKRGDCGRGSGKIGGRSCFSLLENS